MNGLLRHPLRVLARLLWLAGECALVGLDFVFRILLRPGQGSLRARALWLQRGCRRALRIFGVETEALGTIPTSGLLVSNHLSYLDILVLSAVAPAVFIAKREVRNWPVFGWFARLGGTLFVDREKRTRVGEFNGALQTILEQQILVVLFPEGTSSGGQTVLPFKSALLEPAAANSHLVTACSIAYRLEDGDVAEEVCYWKDMTFLPHLINLLSKRRIGVVVRFSELRQESADRKKLARQLHSEVLKLKELHAPMQLVRSIGSRSVQPPAVRQPSRYRFATANGRHDTDALSTANAPCRSSAALPLGPDKATGS
jgi:1-acyl-sn-glycerol-3-phosphate acyltransferase